MSEIKIESIQIAGIEMNPHFFAMHIAFAIELHTDLAQDSLDFY